MKMVVPVGEESQQSECHKALRGRTAEAHESLYKGEWRVTGLQ